MGKVRRRGRGKAKKTSASTEDLSAALKHIEGAGKGGMNARSLASLMSQAGLSKPHKTVLMDSGKVKKTGKGGGTTYVWVG
ncbi:MAG: hypothetical protein H7144_02675 [Burkholderiales bacterium]|nr:hypothetical protein [Phycisphaerae bacterium]